MPARTFPGAEWERIPPEESGFDPERLDRARKWIDDNINGPRYRVVVIHSGRIVAEWNSNVDSKTRFGIASAAKSIYSNVLGIVVAEGKIPSADARVYDYYPEMMDVPEGEGPKDGRYAFPKDQDITFRQLISNTSGYMKPGEAPGKVFHYQTFGMNILTHAIAKVYGYYDIADPEGSIGFGKLIDEKLAEIPGISWNYSLSNFNLHKKARQNIFGYYCQVHSDALNLARLGWLWCNWGRWRDQQVIPESWMRESTKTNADILANCPEEDWQYGYGFWTNDHGQLWSNLPRSGFTASGAGGHYVSVFPSKDLVIVQNPGRYGKGKDEKPERGTPQFLEMILDSLKA